MRTISDCRSQLEKGRRIWGEYTSREREPRALRHSDTKTISNLRLQISEEDLKRYPSNLYGWIENLKSSGISGQRHLDEKAKTKYAGKQDREAFLEELRHITESASEQRKKL